MKTAWELKQTQLTELTNILVHENYTETGLATGNSKIKEAFEGLSDYIEKANKTAWEEKSELKDHSNELEDLKVQVETHSCNCVWGQWQQWSPCTKTCGSGLQSRSRKVKVDAINGGTCFEHNHEQILCNESCCRKLKAPYISWKPERFLYTVSVSGNLKLYRNRSGFLKM